MFLSDLYMSASLNPGESINVMPPVVLIFTPEVTESKLYLLVKCEAWEPGSQKLSAKICATFESTVDFPWPHSPKTRAFHLFLAFLSIFSDESSFN